jgi:transposase
LGTLAKFSNPYRARLELEGIAQDERCRRLVAVEDMTPLAATAMVGAVGDARRFKAGKNLQLG